jgi:hypothetical protein
MNTQFNLWHEEERCASHKEILKDVVRKMPDNIPEEKWRTRAMWCALLQYPATIELFKVATELRKYAPTEAAWLDMLEAKIAESSVCDDLPNFETLTRGLRQVQGPYWQKNESYKYAALAKTL